MVSRRRALLACGLGIVLLAGCLGASEAPTDDGAGQAVTAEQSPGAGQVTMDPPSGSIVRYANLTDRQQEAFDRALEYGEVEFSGSLPDVEYGLDVQTPFRKHDYVRKHGTYYEVSRTTFVAAGADRVDVESVDGPGNATVVHLENRSGTGYWLLERAIENDGTFVKKGVRSPVDAGTILEYRGEYYRLTDLTHVDYGKIVVTFREFDGQ